MKKQKILAIIPARGGSKAIPMKNIKFLAGKPLVAYSIETARNSELVDKTIVSTDSHEIAEISKEYGAEIIKRPAELATDTSPTELAMIHAVQELEKKGYVPDLIVLLQPTSPLRKKDDVDNAIKKLIETNSDSLFSASEGHNFLWRMHENSAVPLNFDFKNRKRRQDLEPQYRENGSIFVTKREILMSQKNRLGGKRGIYVMGKKYSFEVDTLFEFWLIEQIIKHENGNKG